MKILIAEDDFIARKVLFNFLTKYGEIDVSENGQEALKLFTRQLKHGDGYDLVCLDIMMPRLNGHEALEEIRRIEAEYGKKDGKRVKIIMTTALDDSQNILTSFNNQCDGYITKPYSWEKLETEVQRVLKAGKA
ncbi:MAG: response regulator [Proteobacteria bacterium]|nr:response regulator [Pseudomonadota bacterium]MBU1641286.1 response regulator [Pseudomonadota bacterium]